MNISRAYWKKILRSHPSSSFTSPERGAHEYSHVYILVDGAVVNIYTAARPGASFMTSSGIRYTDESHPWHNAEGCL